MMRYAMRIAIPAAQKASTGATSAGTMTLSMQALRR